MSKEKLQWFEESLLEVRKVTKVTTGWRRMRFRATVLVWDRGWNIGIGVGKGTDVAIAVSKATHDAYKNITQVPVTLFRIKLIVSINLVLLRFVQPALVLD